MAQVRVVMNAAAVQQALRSSNGPVVRDLRKRADRVRNAAIRNLTASGAVDTGALRASVTVEMSSSPSGVPMARVGTNLPYGRYVEEGTGIYGPKGRPIRPKNGRLLRWPVKNNSGSGRRRYRGGATAKYAFAPSVKGMRPRPWLRPALSAAEGRSTAS